MTRAIPCPFARPDLSPVELVADSEAVGVAEDAVGATLLSEGSDELHLIDIATRLDANGELTRRTVMRGSVEARTADGEELSLSISM